MKTMLFAILACIPAAAFADYTTCTTIGGQTTCTTIPSAPQQPIQTTHCTTIGNITTCY